LRMHEGAGFDIVQSGTREQVDEFQLLLDL
jgi:hypothetical protein